MWRKILLSFIKIAQHAYRASSIFYLYMLGLKTDNVHCENKTLVTKFNVAVIIFLKERVGAKMSACI